MSQATKSEKWLVNAELGQITNANVSKTITLNTKDTYLDRDISINVSADKPDNATLSASATGSATISTVSVGTKANNQYPVTGSASITGTANANTTTSGFATQNTTKATGSTTGTASVSANIPAASATVSFSGNAAKPTVATDAANDNVSAGTATTTQPTSGYYAAVKATAPKTTLRGTTTVGTAGYLGDKSEISASAATTARTGDTYYVPITAGEIGVSSSNAPTGYTENTTAIVPTAGSLTLDEGYYPKTFIKLSTLVPDEATITNNATGASTIRTGTSAYDKDGNLITGTMGVATVKGGTLSHSLSAPAYNATDDNFTMDCEVTAGAPSVTTAGYISSTEGTKTASEKVTEAHTLSKVVLGTSKTSGNLTVAPTLVRTAKPSGDTWVDAASGSATTTKPTTADPYIQIDAAAATNTLKVKPTVTTAGYGDTTNYGFAEYSGTVGAAKATTAYVPIQKANTSVTGGSANATGTNLSLGTKTTTKPSSGKYITVTGTGSLNVTQAGWIDSGTKAGGSQTAYYTINPSTQTNSCTATATVDRPSVLYDMNMETTDTDFDMDEAMSTGILFGAIPMGYDYITFLPSITPSAGVAHANATASCTVTEGYADAGTKPATATQSNEIIDVDVNGDIDFFTIRLYNGAYEII